MPTVFSKNFGKWTIRHCIENRCFEAGQSVLFWGTPPAAVGKVAANIFLLIRRCKAQLLVESSGIRRRRSRAAAPELPDRDAELLRLVSEVVLNAGAGEHHDPDRQHFQHRVVAFERRGLGMPGPVGLEGDL